MIPILRHACWRSQENGVSASWSLQIRDRTTHHRQLTSWAGQPGSFRREQRPLGMERECCLCRNPELLIEKHRQKSLVWRRQPFVPVLHPPSLESRDLHHISPDLGKSLASTGRLSSHPSMWAPIAASLTYGSECRRADFTLTKMQIHNPSSVRC